MLSFHNCVITSILACFIQFLWQKSVLRQKWINWQVFAVDCKHLLGQQETSQSFQWVRRGKWKKITEWNLISTKKNGFCCFLEEAFFLLELLVVLGVQRNNLIVMMIMLVVLLFFLFVYKHHEQTNEEGKTERSISKYHNIIIIVASMFEWTLMVDLAFILRLLNDISFRLWRLVSAVFIGGGSTPTTVWRALLINVMADRGNRSGFFLPGLYIWQYSRLSSDLEMMGRKR